MLVPPHRTLVLISMILITLPVVPCSPQVDLGLEQTVGDNQRAAGDFLLSNIDVEKYPAPASTFKFITDITQKSKIQDFLQWIHPPEPPKCDGGLFAFCCSWPAPSPNVGIRMPPKVNPEEVKKRRRKCGKWNQNRPGCLIPENNFCCDCKDVNDVAYNCYNPLYRDDPRFQGKPVPKPSPIGHPTELNRPAPLELDLEKSKDFYHDPQDVDTEKHDKIERSAVVTSATNEIKRTTDTFNGGGGIGRTRADTQHLRAWKMAQPQAAHGGDDPDGTAQDVKIMRAWKRAQPAVAVADGDDADKSGEEAEIGRAWKRTQSAVADGHEADGTGEEAEIVAAWKRVSSQIVDDVDGLDGTGVDVEVLRSWKRAPPQVTDDGDDPDGTEVDVEIMGAWKRAQREVSGGDNTDGTGAEDAQQVIMPVWKRAQPEVSAGDTDSTEKVGAGATLLFEAWKLSPAWESETSEGISADQGNEGEGEEQYEAGNPGFNHPALCTRKYLEDLGIFS